MYKESSKSSYSFGFRTNKIAEETERAKAKVFFALLGADLFLLVFYTPVIQAEYLKAAKSDVILTYLSFSIS